MKAKFILIIMSIFSFLSCNGTKSTKVPIKSFTYHYDGTIGGNSFTYSIKPDSAGHVFRAEMLEHMDYGEMSCPLDETFMENLRLVCEKHDIFRWNGYDKNNPHVCDGHGFSLDVEYEDGCSVDVHGMNMSPNGYWDFDKEMLALFKPVVDSLLEEGKQRQIAAGVSGPMTSIIMNFIQKGTSGSDSYEVFFLRREIRSGNFSVRIKSRSGEFFPVGEWNYYGDADDDKICWDAFADLVKKYDIIKWYDYDKAAEDYNNAEWFQLSCGFENGHISAYGTEHPENYDAFRTDFLQLLRKVVDKSGIEPNK